jgi:hypothetical protein
VIELALASMGIGFIIAQGGAVFLTAWLAHRYLALAAGWWKPMLMLLSYFAWVFATGIGWSLLGGGWGLMEGGVMILSLFVSAALSSLVFLVFWLVLPLMNKKLENG